MTKKNLLESKLRRLIRAELTEDISKKITKKLHHLKNSIGDDLKWLSAPAAKIDHKDLDAIISELHYTLKFLLEIKEELRKSQYPK